MNMKLPLPRTVLKIIFGVFVLVVIFNLAYINSKFIQKKEEEPPKKPENQLISQSGDKELKIIEICGPECLRVIESTASALTQKIEAVEKKIGQGKQAPAAGSSTGAKVTYIPIGITGAATSRTDWTTISDQSIYLSGDDFPGYKHMVLDGYLKVKDGNGKAFARLLNSNDGTALLGSEMETGAYDLTLVESGQFRIPQSKKLFKLQLKSLTGYEASSGLIRIKVVF